MMRAKELVLAAAAMVLMISVTRADVVVTYAENPGDEYSSLSNTSVYNFGPMSVGKHYNVAWSGIGSFDQVDIVGANQYGGAVPQADMSSDFTPGTHSTYNTGTPGNYPEVGSSWLTPTTLTLNSAVSYFGLWWSAGDPGNVLNFYNGSTLVAHFTTQNLIDNLPSAYKGNPNKTFAGQDSAEGFAFINFYATVGTSWDKVIFSNTGSSGFESANDTVDYSWAPGDAEPGIGLEQVNAAGVVTMLGGATDYGGTVPEPTIIAGLLVTLAASGLAIGKRNALKV